MKMIRTYGMKRQLLIYGERPARPWEKKAHQKVDWPNGSSTVGRRNNHLRHHKPKPLRAAATRRQNYSFKKKLEGNGWLTLRTATSRPSKTRYHFILCFACSRQLYSLNSNRSSQTKWRIYPFILARVLLFTFPDHILEMPISFSVCNIMIQKGKLNRVAFLFSIFFPRILLMALFLSPLLLFPLLLTDGRLLAFGQ